MKDIRQSLNLRRLAYCPSCLLSACLKERPCRADMPNRGVAMFIEDYGEFKERVGMLRDLKNTLGLDVEFSIIGLVLDDKLPELLEFCAENKGFHIVSVVGGVIVNRLVTEATRFFLANGNPDPSLKFQSPLREIVRFDYFD